MLLACSVDTPIYDSRFHLLALRLPVQCILGLSRVQQKCREKGFYFIATNFCICLLTKILDVIHVSWTPGSRFVCTVLSTHSTHHDTLAKEGIVARKCEVPVVHVLYKDVVVVDLPDVRIAVGKNNGRELRNQEYEARLK